MSRSRKRTPISGITGAESEKQDKRINNRRFRRRVKQVMDRGDAESWVLPLVRDVSDPWLMDKDGKFAFDPREYPRLMRK